MTNHIARLDKKLIGAIRVSTGGMVYVGHPTSLTAETLTLTTTGGAHVPIPVSRIKLAYPAQKAL